jgi:hypothetical protein
MTRIRTLSLSLLLAVVAAGLATAAPNKPKSVIHVITIQWKADATPEQIQRAIRAAEREGLAGRQQVGNFVEAAAGFEIHAAKKRGKHQRRTV